MIQLINISKSFKKCHALKNISVDFQKGQVVSLIGPNGSGKTTIIKCILGLVKPDQGDIRLDNHSILNNDQYRKRIGYMPQIGRFPDQMKIGQVFKILKTVRNQDVNELDEELIQSYGLNDIADKSMRALSGGTRQKVSAAIAFLFDPEILILDEPTAGLDPLASEILKEKIQKEKSKNKLILITSHILSDFDELTTDVLYLQEGKIEFSGDMDYLKNSTGEIKFAKAIATLMKSKGN